MADYIELSLPVLDAEQSEIFIAELAEYPFESFQQEENLLKAYIREDELAECRSEIDAFMRERRIYGTYTKIETVNWNAQWEADFQPVDVDGKCLVRAPFHEADGTHDLDIVIMPKMSFGTGHHSTTWLMLSSILDQDFKGKEGLDMGSGTGVLAIAAVKLGAGYMDAVDIDEWAFDNCVENITVNGVADYVKPILGDVSAIAGKKYDFILANINRNILLADIDAYVDTLAPGGVIVMSGILEQDIEAVDEKAISLGLKQDKIRVKEGWAAIEYTK